MSSASADYGVSRSIDHTRSSGRSVSSTLALLLSGMIVGVVAGVLVLFPSVFARRLPSAALSFEPASTPLTLPPAAAAAPAPPPAMAQAQAQAQALAAPPPVAQPAAPFVPPAAAAVEPVDADETLVTFQVVNKGLRVFVDGVPITSAEPMKMECGKHSVRVASFKARKINFPCGAALTLD
jgi:hypothetical protein